MNRGQRESEKDFFERNNGLCKKGKWFHVQRKCITGVKKQCGRKQMRFSLCTPERCVEGYKASHGERRNRASELEEL